MKANINYEQPRTFCYLVCTYIKTRGWKIKVEWLQRVNFLSDPVVAYNFILPEGTRVDNDENPERALVDLCRLVANKYKLPYEYDPEEFVGLQKGRKEPKPKSQTTEGEHDGIDVKFYYHSPQPNPPREDDPIPGYDFPGNAFTDSILRAMYESLKRKKQ